VNPKLKTTLIVLLAITTIGAGALAWQQSRALAALRIAQARDTNADRAALEKRLADAEHRAHELQNELAALKARAGNDDAPADDPQNAAAGGRSRFRGPGGPEAFMAMMNDPKIAQLVNNREKLMLDSRYAALFKNLTQGTNGVSMTPEQLDAFKNLLVEKENTLRDVMMTARSQGVTDRSEINQLVKTAQAEVDTQLQSTLGDAGYQQYQQYEQTLPQRNLVNQLTQSLSYTSTPLSDSQSQQLLQILADNSKPASSGQLRSALGFGGGPGGGPGGFLGVPITDAAVTQAQSVLAPAQLQALTTLQEQQKAQQTMIDTMRANRQNANAAQSTPTPTTQTVANPAK
jgi:hypothetical protein